jgi:ComF family protein
VYQGLVTHIRELGSASIDLFAGFIFPATCAGCNCSGTWLCPKCQQRLVEVDARSAALETDPSGMSVELRARFVYVEPVRRAIHLLKYEGERARSAWFAAQLESTLVGIQSAHTLLESVPLSPRRERSRGFNQSREIALLLSASTNVPLGDDIVRVRDTRPQVELSGLERITNVRDAFRVDTRLDGKQIVLVDDVITTGATMRECALACYEAGAASVLGLAVARALDDRQ